MRFAGKQFVHEGFLGNNGQNANDKHDGYEKPCVCGAPLALHQPVDVATVGREAPDSGGVDEGEDEVTRERN